MVLQFLCRSSGCVPLSKNTAWLISTALSAPKEYWLDIATIGLCFYFIRMIKKSIKSRVRLYCKSCAFTGVKYSFNMKWSQGYEFMYLFNRKLKDFDFYMKIRTKGHIPGCGDGTVKLLTYISKHHPRHKWNSSKGFDNMYWRAKEMLQ